MVNLIIPTLIIATLAFVLSAVGLIMIIAQKLSTHKIEWKPLVTSDVYEKTEEEIEETEEEEDKILQEALKLQRSGKMKNVDPLDEILETNNF